MGSDAIVNAPGFYNASAKKKKGSKQAKLKQNKVDVRKQENFCPGKKEQAAILQAKPPTSRNGHERHGAQHIQTTSARKHEPVPTKYNNLALSWMNNSTVRRSDQYSKDFNAFRNSRGGSCSSSCSEEDKDDECLDSWEAMADVLTLTAENNQQSSDSEHHCLKSEATYRAWSPNDVYRPRSLPSITIRGPVFSWRSVVSHQSSTCPICCEDLDSTDSSFIPCPCGFRLCLFCHKTILEVDGRCPGCRKQYDCVSAGASFAVQKTPCSKNSGF